MQPPPDSAPPDSAIAVRWRRAPPAFALAVICLLHAGCGTSAPSTPSRPALLVRGGGGAVAGPRLTAAARLAHRFAAAYASNAYLRHPPRLPGATASVRRSVAAAAARVPPSRRELRPRALALALRPRGSAALTASVRIGDGRSPPFSVGFVVRQRGSGWRVLAISPPG